MKKGIIVIIVILLVCAVVMGALVAFTDVFKKDKTPTDKDKLEYKAMANGDEANTLYFNTEYDFNSIETILNLSFYSEGATVSSNPFSYIFSAKYDGGYVCIGCFIPEIYGDFQLIAIALNTESMNMAEFNIVKSKVLYSSKVDKENGVEKSGWQIDKFDVKEFVGAKKLTVDMSDRLIAFQPWVGQFISANGAFITEV